MNQTIFNKTYFEDFLVIHYLFNNIYSDQAKGYQAWDPTMTKSAAKFKNSVAEPNLDCPRDTLIMNVIPLPELHLHLGIVNRLATELNDRWIIDNPKEDNVYKW